MKYRVLVAGIAVTTALTGCGESTPSDTQAREIVQESFKYPIVVGHLLWGMGYDTKENISAGPLVDFTKVNGESLAESGQKIYVYHFAAAETLPTGMVWLADFNGGTIAKCSVKLCGKESGIKVIPAGAIAVRKGQIKFRMTDKGWVTDGKITNLGSGYCENPAPGVCYNRLGFDKLQ